MAKSPIPFRVRRLDPFEVLRRVAQDYGIERREDGSPGLAVRMGYSPGVLHNKLNCNESGHHKPTLSDFIQVCLITGNYAPLHALNFALAHACFPVRDLGAVSDQALIDHLTRMGQAEGDFHRELSIALDDRKFSREDFERVRQEGLEWISAIAEAIHRIEGMVDG